MTPSTRKTNIMFLKGKQSGYESSYPLCCYLSNAAWNHARQAATTKNNVPLRYTIDPQLSLINIF